MKYKKQTILSGVIGFSLLALVGCSNGTQGTAPANNTMGNSTNTTSNNTSITQTNTTNATTTISSGTGSMAKTSTTSSVVFLPNHRQEMIAQNGVDITFLSPKDGWKMVAYPGETSQEPVDIYKTTDGGQNWNKIAAATIPSSSAAESNSPPYGKLPSDGTKYGLSFVNNLVGWITGTTPRVGYPWLFMTHDGGHTLQHQNLSIPASYAQSQIGITPPSFFTSQDGILLINLQPIKGGNGVWMIYSTHDGGQNWGDPKPLLVSGTSDNLSWRFKTSNIGAVTVNSNTFRTPNGGYTWVK